jgi:hypothetical protein
MTEMCFLKHATTTTVKTNSKESLTTACISKPELAELFEGTCLTVNINFEEILLPAGEKLEEQNNLLESSIIITNYCIIIIIKSYYNYIINA